ncbi:MAG: carbohydrate-binding domain-containing protein [Clostridia bacterium]|nr:carbohydrate-binding domain-containing protein [Clostridia bacterium]
MKKKLLAIALSISMISMFSACADKTNVDGSTPTASAVATTDTPTGVVVTDDDGYDLTFTAKDLDSSFELQSSTQIVFSDSGVTVTGSGAEAAGNIVNISKAGTYVISGSSSDGRINVNAGNSDDVKLVLNGLTLASSTAAITAVNADKVILTLAAGTVNSVADSASYTLDLDGSDADAAIFAKTDLTINGSGTLNVNGNYKHGVVSKDSLAITGGTINVTAVSTGIEGKDCVKAADATVSVTAGTDAIRSTNTDREDRGFVYLQSGVYDLTAGKDGVQAQTMLRVDGGTVNITTGGGSVNGTKAQQFRDMFSGSGSASDSDSAKGLKSDGDIKINGGTLTVDSCDDALHAADEIIINAGTLALSSGDDGIHADNSVEINDGTVEILTSYEGIEGSYITVNGGNISLAASDDGVNISGGNDSGMGFDPFAAASDGMLTINGGTLLVNAYGDGLDSNGSITITGGTIYVSGPTDNGNAALDYNGAATMTGGVLIAAGSGGMAQSVTGSGQGSIMTNITAQSGGTEVALVDANGNVIAAFTPEKQYSNVVFCAPGIASGNTYTVVCGGSTVATVTMDSDNYGASADMGFGGPGGMGGGQMGGPGGGQMPGGFGGRP